MGSQLCFSSPSANRLQNAQPQPMQSPTKSSRSTSNSPLQSRFSRTIIEKIDNRSLFDGLTTNLTGQFKKEWVQVDPNFIYQGEWEGGKRQGKGIMYNIGEGWLICGCFSENKIIEMNCKKIFSNGLEYVGQTNEKFEMHGIGKITGSKYTYQGEFKKDMFDGDGQLENESLNFKGRFEGGKKINGVEITPQGIYEGPFNDNKREGNGTFTWNGGGRYEGTFKNNRMDGQGKLFDSEGNFSGVHTFEDGKLLI